MDVYTNMYVSEAAIPQIVANRYCTHEKKIRVPPFRYLGCVLQCAVFPHTPVHHTLRSLLLFFHFFLVNIPPKLPLKHGPNTTQFFSSSEAKPRENVPPQGASSGAPSPPGGGQGSRRRRDRFRRFRPRRNHQCTGRVQ